MVSHATGQKTGSGHADADATVSVAVPADLAAEIEALAGPGRLHAFVAAAIEGHVRRAKEIRAFVGHLSADDAPDWATEASTAAWLRDIRGWPDPWADGATTDER